MAKSINKLKIVINVIPDRQIKNHFLLDFLTSEWLAPALLIAWNSILLDGRAAVSTSAGASWALGRMWKRPKPGYDQACRAWSSTGGSESILMEPRSDLALNILLMVPLGLMISDVSSLNFPDFCCWLSGPESVMLCSQAGEPGNWCWKKPLELLDMLVLFPGAPFLGREHQSPAWASWAFAFPGWEPASGGVVGTGRDSLFLGEPVLIPLLSLGMALGMGSPSPALSLLS